MYNSSNEAIECLKPVRSNQYILRGAGTDILSRALIKPIIVCSGLVNMNMNVVGVVGLSIWLKVGSIKTVHYYLVSGYQT